MPLHCVFSKSINYVVNPFHDLTFFHCRFLPLKCYMYILTDLPRSGAILLLVYHQMAVSEYNRFTVFAICTVWTDFEDKVKNMIMFFRNTGLAIIA